MRKEIMEITLDTFIGVSIGAILGIGIFMLLSRGFLQ
jgi:uncharacterized membrane protein YgaE (UPF0421/DUF939 family)